MYYELFKKLTSPSANNENEFKTSLIPKTSHRVAKNAKGLPSILINTKDDDSLINTFNSELSKKIVLPLINDISFQCLEKFNNISIEEVCRIAKTKNLKKSIPKKVDFVI